jgi:hypothetical protein
MRRYVLFVHCDAAEKLPRSRDLTPDWLSLGAPSAPREMRAWHDRRVRVLGRGDCGAILGRVRELFGQEAVPDIVMAMVQLQREAAEVQEILEISYA